MYVMSSLDKYNRSSKSWLNGVKHTANMQAIAKELSKLAEAQERAEQSTRMDIDGDNSEAISVRLEDLFDLSKQHWRDKATRAADGSLDDEMRVYELLDLDAPGEPNPEIDLEDAINDYFDN